MENDILVPNGQGGFSAQGTVAERLLKSGLNINALRTNATLRKEEWLQFDTVVVETARDRLIAVDDLLSRSLVLPLKNAMGTTVIEWETLGKMRAAEVNMDGITRAAADRPNYESVTLPIPITHENFQFNIRALEASRRLGNTLDTTAVMESTLQVVESLEDQLFNGVSITFANSTIYGYTNHPNRNQVSLPAAWDSSGITGELIVADVLSMIAAAHVDRMFGPYVIYVPTAYWIPLVDDFKAQGDRTTLERILAIPNIDAVKVSDRLTADNILMIQMTKNVIDMVVGMQPTLLEWSGEGGLQSFFKVMAIMVPRPKATQTGQSGIIHMS
ncbi:hypothetical protein LCGC14_0982970 [marine sediment metagenome]|uniref:Encapsulating protein for peroxidase n=1 Tax=marine sediment metagenome TaxID=412755 RepID=A0A0F9NCP1_9ZZZZ